MSIISAVQTFIKTYTGLNGLVYVDMVGQNPTEYAVVPIPGTRIVEKYLDNSSLREFNFAFQSVESTADDAARLGNSEFYENFADWLESQTESGTLPTMASGKTAEKIEAVTGGYLYQEGESGTAIYQITCKLTYSQDA